jgi:nucleoside-diphosphate-sugar epimerase
MRNSNRAFVAGGTGTAGRAYSRALVAAGYEVVATAGDDDGARTLADVGADLAVDRLGVELTPVEDFLDARFAAAGASTAEQG